MVLGAHDCQAPLEMFAPDRCDPPALHSRLGVGYRSTAEADLCHRGVQIRRFQCQANVFSAKPISAGSRPLATTSMKASPTR